MPARCAVLGRNTAEWLHDALVQCGWGRLIFANTFGSPASIVRALCEENGTERDIAFYVTDPQSVLQVSRGRANIDPSQSLRLDLSGKIWRNVSNTCRVRQANGFRDVDALNSVYAARSMPVLPHGIFDKEFAGGGLRLFVAEEGQEVVGGALGIDHLRVAGDPDRGASLWYLVVSSKRLRRGYGEALVRGVARGMAEGGARSLDLSVLYENVPARSLYRKLGFKRLYYFSLKRVK